MSLAALDRSVVQPCHCPEPHEQRRIVLTGGPGAGKTAVLEVVRKTVCRHVVVLPETAGILFGGGFPRGFEPEQRRAAQRAIFFVQRELEATASAGPPSVLLCDRGTVDGAAYWPGPGDIWTAVGATAAEHLARYDAVIHLRSPAPGSGYNHDNPLRIEAASEAAAIDERIAIAWQDHPHRHVVPAVPEFLAKASQALLLLRAELPDCCKQHIQV